MRGSAFSGNLNFDSYFAIFNSADEIAGLDSAPTIRPYKLVVEDLNWSTLLTMSISEVNSSLGWSGSNTTDS